MWIRNMTKVYITQDTGCTGIDCTSTNDTWYKYWSQISNQYDVPWLSITHNLWSMYQYTNKIRKCYKDNSFETRNKCFQLRVLTFEPSDFKHFKAENISMFFLQNEFLCRFVILSFTKRFHSQHELYTQYWEPTPCGVNEISDILTRSPQMSLLNEAWFCFHDFCYIYPHSSNVL